MVNLLEAACQHFKIKKTPTSTNINLIFTHTHPLLVCYSHSYCCLFISELHAQKILGVHLQHTYRWFTVTAVEESVAICLI